MHRRPQLAAVGLVVVAVGAGLWFGRGPASPAPPTNTTLPVAIGPIGSAPDQETIVVHVSGWVARPGLVEVKAVSRVADAIAAAGGARPGAALGAMNLAEPLSDGQQVVVPGPGANLAARQTAGLEPEAARVRINIADQATLEVLPGVGPVLAKRIIDHRQENGPFETVEDLLAVPGIGEQKLAALRDLVVVP